MLCRIIQRFLRDAENQRRDVAVQIRQRTSDFERNGNAVRFADRSDQPLQRRFQTQIVENLWSQQAR